MWVGRPPASSQLSRSAGVKKDTGVIPQSHAERSPVFFISTFNRRFHGLTLFNQYREKRFHDRTSSHTL